jgi:RsmE family RNA methyltransferase
MQDISEAKKIRIHAIAREALEQCGANKSLQVEYSPQGLQKLLEAYSGHMHIVGHYEGKELPKIPKETPLVLWVGPEGGWSVNEKQFFEEQKMIFWKFNNRILRLETAAIVGVGIILS